MSGGISFSFGAKGKGKAAPPSRRPGGFSALGGGDDEEEVEGDGLASVKKSKATNKTGGLLSQPPTNGSSLSRQQRLKQQQAKDLDATVFEYDEVYDDMKDAERQAKAAKDALGQERKPQYISGLLETAKQRQIDRQRAEDTLVARERQAEGEDFVDKDAFVTPAYVEQQKEFRRLEEEERLKAEKGPTNEGRDKFYKGMLDEESEKRKAAMEAVAKASERRKAAAAAAGPGSGSLGLSSILADEAARPSQPAPGQAQYDPEPEAPPSEAQVAAEAGKRLGKKVELDDEGRIVDHRQLLSGGLNVGSVKKGPTKDRGFALPMAQRAQEDREKLAAQARDEMHEVGEDGMTRAEKVKMSRERQSRMLQAQLIEVEEKKRKAEEDELAEGRKKVSVRRNDESRVEEMKRKALERRRAREELASSAS